MHASLKGSLSWLRGNRVRRRATAECWPIAGCNCDPGEITVARGCRHYYGTLPGNKAFMLSTRGLKELLPTSKLRRSLTCRTLGRFASATSSSMQQIHPCPQEVAAFRSFSSSSSNVKSSAGKEAATDGSNSTTTTTTNRLRSWWQSGNVLIWIGWNI